MNPKTYPSIFRAMLCLCLFFASIAGAKAQYENWQHHGSLTVLTTPAGANLPAGAELKDFPLLVRLSQEWFDFKQARPKGEDLRFAAVDGSPLSFEIDTWDPDGGNASVWVRIPIITGNARQQIQMYWGKSDATSESNGSAVFNASNGYISVFHMNESLSDAVGTTKVVDAGTTQAPGIVGTARRFTIGKGILGGEKVIGYPTGSSPHSSEAWFRPDNPNAIVLAWGNEAGQGKVTMRYSSPPHVNMECYFSGADVSGKSSLTPSEWVHVVHTYVQGESRIYVNGVLDGVNKTSSAPLNIKSPARMYLGGWYGDYRFVGDIDEVRISNETRSADWVKLEYENQKPLQTAVGPLIQPGSDLWASASSITLMEGKSASISAKAGGAEKLYWVLTRAGKETIEAVDRFSFTLHAGRVTGDTHLNLQLKAVYPHQVKVLNIPVLIKEDIPDPDFTLAAPTKWNGRTPIVVSAYVNNAAALKIKSADKVQTVWDAGPFAVIKEEAPGKLILKRAQNSGLLTVTATLNNGGQSVTRSVNIRVKEPATDPYVSRTPGNDEKPEEGQFYARDDHNEGVLVYNGKLDGAADSVFLRVKADGKPYKMLVSRVTANRVYGFTVRLKPGFIKYSVEFGTKSGNTETIKNSVGDIVCGDAFLIDGQSNALATDTGEKSPAVTNEWIRSYQRAPNNEREAVGNGWCKPVWKSERGEPAELGWWGMELAKRLVEAEKVPIFVINAAVGGTRIDQHQRNLNNPTDLTTLYGRMLWRVQHARLTHGIRGILWHQGENDQGSDGPTGGYGWQTYQRLFVEMSAGWKQDFPNLKRYYLFQIWPNSCSMGGRNGSGDMLREKQRTLPGLYSNMSIMSTLGIHPAGGCHFPLDGWSEFARLILPVIESDSYGKTAPQAVTAPNLKKVRLAGSEQNRLTLEFDQPMQWSDNLVGQFYIDGDKGRVSSGSAVGNIVTLNLKAPLYGQSKITYLKEIDWSQNTLLTGSNGIAALTFCLVPIEPK